MPDTPATKKKKPGFFQRLANLVKELVEWVDAKLVESALVVLEQARIALTTAPRRPIFQLVPPPKETTE